ncbi:MAG: MFS transporter [Verrucomicrobia bacterium]|nr:MFS transporter [Verrucomicrobiota bacterium]
MTSANAQAASSRATRVRYLVLAALCAAAAISYMSRNCLGVAVADGKIGRELQLTDRQIAWVMAAFFASYSVFQIPSGWTVQMLGSRRALPLFASVWSMATATMGLATGFVSLLAAQLGMGLAQAGVFPASTHSIGQWMPSTRRAVACGWLASCMSAGGAVAVALTGWMLEGLNWRWVFAVFCLPGLLWSAWFYFWFRNTPGEHQVVSQAELEIIRGTASQADKDGPPLPSPLLPSQGREGEILWKQILTSVPMWLICGQQFFRAAGYIFYGTWFPKFLKETRGVSTAEAGYLTSLPLLATVVGALLSGFVIDWILVKTGSRRWSRQGVAIAAMSVCGGFSLLAYYANDAGFAVLLITAGSFCAACGGPCAYATTIDMGGKQVPMVFSLMNTAGNLGAFLCPVVVERIVAATGNWNLVLLFFTGIFFSAALCWSCLNPSGTIVKPAAQQNS